MKAVITGATGFVGRRLIERLDEVVVLTRNPAKAKKSLPANVKTMRWNPETEPAPAAAFEGAEAVFHLAGEPVAEGRWTAAKKQRLRESRVAGTRNLVQTLVQVQQKPKALISASAVGYYGDRGEQLLPETAPPADDFLAEICREWENASKPAESRGIRVVNLRIGIVLGPGGGALKKMLPPFYMGMGSPLGSGKQYMPWIHLDDLVDLMLFAAMHDTLRGPVNAAAPHPVTNAEFTKTLGATLHRPTFMPAVPEFALKLALGEFARVLTGSQRTTSQKAIDGGFRFQFPELRPALDDILRRKR